MKYSKEFKNKFGLTSYSNPFFINGEISPITEKFNRLSFGIKIKDERIIELLKNEGVKLYGKVVFVELKNKTEFKTYIDNEIPVCIKKFININGDVFNKLIYSN